MIAAIVMIAGFGFTVDQASAATGPTSINLKVASGTGTSAVVDINGKVKVYVSSVYPSTRSKSVIWSIVEGKSYGKLVSVNSSYCYVQGIKAGTMTIKAKSKYYPYAFKYIKVYVKQLYPTAVTLNKASLNMWVGKTYPLTATVTKASWVYNAGVSWTTSSSGIATVGTTGTVKAVSTGTSTITATSKDKTTLKDTCPVNVYDAAMTVPGRINLLSGATMDNPVVVTGPGVTNITPARTVTYVSSDPTLVAVDANGKITASDTFYGSATITATVSMPSITSTYKTKVITYPVNIKEPVGVTENEFTIDQNWGFLQINRTSEGFLGGTEIVLSKSQLDDLFGYGSLGINLWDPMDMYVNFQAKNFSLQGGDFSFDKLNQTDPTIPDVEVLAKVVHLYWLDDIAGDKNAVDLTYDTEGLTTGYSLKFYYDESLSDTAYDHVTLLGNVLSLKFDTVDLNIERLASNKVQLLADADADTNTAMTPVMTIMRTTTGYHVTINDADYMDAQGIDFSLYKTYL